MGNLANHFSIMRDLNEKSINEKCVSKYDSYEFCLEYWDSRLSVCLIQSQTKSYSNQASHNIR